MTTSVNLPVLYSFRRCPYAMRARLALYLSGVSVELREVVLKDKPESMLALSPKGTVPVLQLEDGTVLEESLDIILWARRQARDGVWPDRGAEEEALALQLVQRVDSEFKFHLDRYKYPNRYEGAVAETHKAEAVKFLKDINSRLEQAPYLSGDAPGMADYATMPFVRQFSGVDAVWFKSQPWHAVLAWLEDLTAAAPFVAIMHKYSQWHEGDDPIVLQGVN